MGFYIRKGVSAGPFRFNLSRSGLGVSVGVRGFRVGSGPRGNYVHMGRGGIYYRASLGPAPGNRPCHTRSRPGSACARAHLPEAALSPVEIGNVLEMGALESGSQVLRESNQKTARVRFWPWVLVSGLAAAMALEQRASRTALCTGAPGLHGCPERPHRFSGHSKKTVVLLYDLAEDVVAALQAFAGEFDKVASASRIWNIDTAGRTYDWKRNAGASRLITRKRVTLGYDAPKVVKTNLSLPCIVGGRQNLYFFPDTIIVKERSNFGAISYDDFDVYWNTTVFI